jgi:DNA-directed RNA polymerase subunit alpha
MPVENLNLTMRTLNCLKRASIHKVGEVLERDRDELLRIRNFGEKSLDELDERLREIGITHPGLRTQESAPDPLPVAAASEQAGEEEE